MSFVSGAFLIFLPLTLLAFHLVPRQWRIWLILLASYLFYGYFRPEFALLLVASTLVDFYVAKAIPNRSKGQRRLLLTTSIVANIGLLAYFKYRWFLGMLATDPGDLIHATAYLSDLHILIPIGISFYTFQTLAYTIDVYRGRIQPIHNLGHYAAYVSFFPQLVAGPIERFGYLMPQLEGMRKFKLSHSDFQAGLRLFIWGYFKKVAVADRIAAWIDPIFQNPGHHTGLLLLLSGFLFLVQIYADFSGYTDIARGVARWCGVKLSPNWAFPLFAHSTRDFWRRWHVSLTSWFRDYVYIPLGGNRLGFARQMGALMIVFSLSGLWHGANLTFILWGLCNGLLLMGEMTAGRWGIPRLPRGLGWLWMILTQSLLFLIFRSQSTADLGVIARQLSDSLFAVTQSLQQLDAMTFGWYGILATVLMMTIMLVIENYKLRPMVVPIWTRNVGYLVLVWCIFLFGRFGFTQFIYFQF